MTDRTVSPRGRDIAEALLVAADRVGHPPEVVRTTLRGYAVPEDVAAEYQRMISGDTTEDDTEPTRKKKRAAATVAETSKEE